MVGITHRDPRDADAWTVAETYIDYSFAYCPASSVVISGSDRRPAESCL